MSKDDYK